jgi:hypothetical protein
MYLGIGSFSSLFAGGDRMPGAADGRAFHFRYFL